MPLFHAEVRIVTIGRMMERLLTVLHGLANIPAQQERSYGDVADFHPCCGLLSSIGSTRMCSGAGSNLVGRAALGRVMDMV